MATRGEAPDDGHGPDPSKDRCSESGRDGERCKNAAVPGLSRCHQHIGAESSGSTSQSSSISGRPSAARASPTLADDTEDVDRTVEPEPDPGSEPEPDTRPVWERQREELLGSGT